MTCTEERVCIHFWKCWHAAVQKGDVPLRKLFLLNFKAFLAVGALIPNMTILLLSGIRGVWDHTDTNVQWFYCLQILADSWSSWEGFAAPLHKSQRATAAPVVSSVPTPLPKKMSPLGLHCLAQRKLQCLSTELIQLFTMENYYSPARLSDSTRLNTLKSFWAAQKTEFLRKSVPESWLPFALHLGLISPKSMILRQENRGRLSEQEKCIYQRLGFRNRDLDISDKSVAYLVFLTLLAKVHY